MRIIAQLFLFFFIFSISSPVIVMLIENNSDVSLLLDSTEEKENKEKIEEVKELKANILSPCKKELFFSINTVSSKIIVKNISKHDEVLEEIFSPPPELI